MFVDDNVFLTTARVNSFPACHLVSDGKAVGHSKLHNHRGTALTSNLINPVKLIFFSSQPDRVVTLACACTAPIEARGKVWTI